MSILLGSSTFLPANARGDRMPRRLIVNQCAPPSSIRPNLFSGD
jgi:hypothetical protein